MDLVSRLKTFIDFMKVPVTQFADTCGIPRPTLSQLLNGRNKKVSDEIIGKIHDAYPSLSVLWLMFGEGNMVADANMETSVADSEPMAPYGRSYVSGNEMQAEPSLFSVNIPDSKPEKYQLGGRRESEGSTPSRATEITFIDDDSEPRSAHTVAAQPSPRTAASIAPKADDNRRVSHIIVYYNDNTFETFVPRQ